MISTCRRNHAGRRSNCAPPAGKSATRRRATRQRARHTLSASARGDAPQGEFDLQARAGRRLANGQGWQGRVLKLSNQGRLPLALDAPASVQVQDAQRWRLSGARLRAWVRG